ncbi:acetamidase/formamidase family protein [Alkalihalobacillus sp. AL-G]|uniref:acetamidase/formamidase family protein n=1 Tax=Alkalihalobacillus sp. AL-G TaxID=2926399 RepID=UPI00272BAEE0|nr:acetamidase/formamidase family protein [Alkalihalobacillus sp. AL-G]WLD92958.1 acetamidase/formamidase family protein [Alkalihalobacillus sp. AL-G]
MSIKTLFRDRTFTHFSSENDPTYTIDLGEKVMVETHDCYGGRITDERTLRTNLDLTGKINQATGPIYINGVRKGDVLCIEVGEITLNDYGVMVMMPGLGPLGSQIGNTTTKILRINENIIHFSETIRIPVQPMVGVIGVAPTKGSIQNETPGDHGGNLDTKEITTGSKVYLPVRHDGALLGLGDMHAAMGDGELDGTGVEVAGAVQLTVTKAENWKIESPVVETSNSYLILCSGEGYESTIERALLMTVQHIQRTMALDFEDAYRLLSATCDLKISQIVNPLITVKVSIPKTLVPQLF